MSEESAEISQSRESTPLREIQRPSFMKTDRFVMFCLYGGSLLVHTILGLFSTIFNLTPDEYSVTAIAALLNGYNWEPSVSLGGYYGYLQGLFYTPVFWITEDPFIRYKLMVIINGILMSFVPVIVYYLAKKVFDVKKTAAVIFALICGWYPSYILLTKYTWNETMCNVIIWVFALLVFKAALCEDKVKKQIFSILGGLTLVAGYATHGRMLALLAAGAVLQILVFATMKKKRIFCFTGFYGTMAVGLVADKFIKKFFQTTLWGVGVDNKEPTNTIEKMLEKIIGSDGASGSFSIVKFFKTLVGHFFYFISSTWGFGAICFVLIVTAIVLYYKRRNKAVEYNEDGSQKPNTGAYCSDNTAVLCWLAFLAVGAIFFVSVTFKSVSTLYEKRADTLIYGRYTEQFYPLAIFAGLLLIYKGKCSILQHFASICTASVTFVLTQFFVVPITTNAETFVSAMVLGLSPLRYNEAVKDLPTEQTFIKIYITVMTMLLVWLIIGMFRKFEGEKYKFVCFPLAGLLLYTNIFGFTQYVYPQTVVAKKGAVTMQEAINKLDGEFDTVVLYGISRDRYVKAQFCFPDIKIIPVSSMAKYEKITDPVDVVLSGKEDVPELLNEGFRLIGSMRNSIHIYAVSDRAVEWAENKGYLVGESNSVRYSAAELPMTTSAVRENFSESSDLDFSEESDTYIVLPNGAAVYTNNTNFDKKGTYTFTVKGEGVGNGKIRISKDKNATEMDYEIVEQSDNILKVNLELTEKAEEVCFRLTNTNPSQIIVNELVLEKAS